MPTVDTIRGGIAMLGKNLAPEGHVVRVEISRAVLPEGTLEIHEVDRRSSHTQEISTVGGSACDHSRTFTVSPEGSEETLEPFALWPAVGVTKSHDLRGGGLKAEVLGL